MGLIGAPEVAALSFDFQNSTVHGVRLFKHARRGIELVKSAVNHDADIMVAANRVLKDLSVTSSVYLILSVPLEGCEIFDCELPAAAPDVMREALRFEVPRQLMSVPENFQLQHVVLGNKSESGMCRVRCCVFPDESLRKFSSHLVTLRNKPDAVINPLLTLPAELPKECPVCCPGAEDGFCWQNNSWQILSDELRSQCNKQWLEVLRGICAGKNAEIADEFAPALSAALLGIRKLFTDNAALTGVVILPDTLRPARFRTQLRLTALLVVLLLLVNGFRYGGGYLNKYSELRKLSAQVNNAKSKVQELRKKVKTAEKQLKDFQRTADLNIGSRDCLPYLAYLSEKLPIEIRVTNFRWNEDSVDLNLQTTAPELDLVSFFNRLPGTKILNASQRTNPGNGLTSGNIKLAWDTEKLQIAVPVAEEVQQ